VSVGVIQDEDLRLVGTAAHTLGGAGRCSYRCYAVDLSELPLTHWVERGDATL